jgi:hypothetical protein
MEFYLIVWQCSGCGSIELTLGEKPQPCERGATMQSVGVPFPHWMMIGELLAKNPNEASDGGA